MNSPIVGQLGSKDDIGGGRRHVINQCHIAESPLSLPPLEITSLRTGNANTSVYMNAHSRKKKNSRKKKHRTAVFVVALAAASRHTLHLTCPKHAVLNQPAAVQLRVS